MTTYKPADIITDFIKLEKAKEEINGITPAYIEEKTRQIYGGKLEKIKRETTAAISDILKDFI